MTSGSEQNRNQFGVGSIRLAKLAEVVGQDVMLQLVTTFRIHAYDPSTANDGGVLNYDLRLVLDKPTQTIGRMLK
jgi:hypothetical protein